MKRLISLFDVQEQELRLSGPPPGPPPGSPQPDYAREPVYFRHLLEHLREARGLSEDAVAADVLESQEQSEAVYA